MSVSSLGLVLDVSLKSGANTIIFFFFFFFSDDSQVSIVASRDTDNENQPK